MNHHHRANATGFAGLQLHRVMVTTRIIYPGDFFTALLGALVVISVFPNASLRQAVAAYAAVLVVIWVARYFRKRSRDT